MSKTPWPNEVGYLSPEQVAALKKHKTSNGGKKKDQKPKK